MLQSIKNVSSYVQCKWLNVWSVYFYFNTLSQPRSQGLFPGLGAALEKALASAGHVSILHPEILGVIN